MQIRKLFLCNLAVELVLGCCFSLCGTPAFGQSYEFTTLDFPGAPITYPLGINNKQEIVGYYLDAYAIPHAFLYKGGKFSAIFYPGSLATATGGINDNGDVAGVYIDRKGFQHGFLMRVPPGCDNIVSEKLARCQPIFQPVDVPGAAQTQGISFEFGPGLGTGAVGLNKADDVVGLYATPQLYSNGFVLHQGHYRPISAPGASLTPGNGTRLFSINNRNVIAGDYIAQAGPAAPPINHGFLLDGDRYIPIFIPGSDQGGFGTQVNGLNDFNSAVGIFSDPFGLGHGFLISNGQAVLIDYPGALFSEAHQINNRGDITGAYTSDFTGQTIHGFVAHRN